MFKKRGPQALLLLFFLLLSIPSFSQKRDSAKADTSKGFVIRNPKPIGRAKALVVVNGKIYKRSIKSIDASSIKEVSILKPKEAISLYGQKGENGAILITTKQ